MRARRSNRRRSTRGAAPRNAGLPNAAPGGVDPVVVGQAPAFESLVRRHYQDVWRLVQRIVRRERDAEEVVGQVFLSARAALGDPREEPLEVWLRRLAVEHAVRATKPGHSRRHKPEEPATLDRQFLEASLATLDGSQRALLALQLEGLDYAQIASCLGTPVGTVRNRLATAREYLSRSLEGQEGGHDA